MGLESRGAIERTLDRINEWGEGTRFYVWMHALDERVSQWSDNHRWDGWAKKFQKQLDSYAPDNPIRDTLSSYFAAVHAREYASWKNEEARFRYLRIIEQTMDKGDPNEIEALNKLRELIF